MRPICRGDHPLGDCGVPKQFSEYPDARADLRDRLGDYCSYCEAQLDVSLAVEHVQPKVVDPDHECTWVNLLLSCARCNSSKGHDLLDLDDYYWPDRDNTFRAFAYSEGGVPTPSPNLDAQSQQRAARTIALVGLDTAPTPAAPQVTERWEHRFDAWGIAVRSLANLQADGCDYMRDQIVATAQSRGYFSIWMTVFRDDPDMPRRFIAAFPGTCPGCFDADGAPVHRPGGAL